MKTTILTTAILLAATLGISQSTFASTRSAEKVNNSLTVANKINKIEIHGNVELYISDGTTDRVKIYGNYFAGIVMTTDQNGVLRISSYQTQKLVVWVTASDLSDLEVYDNAEVRSFGELSSIELDVKLDNNASAQLSMDAYQANLTLNNHAKAALAGDINEVELRYDRSSSVDTTNLVAARLVKVVDFGTIEVSDL